MNTTCIAAVKLSVEVITLSVRDVERALRFYVDQVGFTLDVDYSPNDAFRVVQLTPPGSSCSTQIGSRARWITSQRLSRRHRP
jgi:catechol 2,3-dioxygenase-like lactoylglutathione lyase family enzyme